MSQDHDKTPDLVDVDPCPWCGGTHVQADIGNRFPHMGDDPGPDGWAAVLICSSCAARGPWRKGHTKALAKAAAIRSWNRKPTTEQHRGVRG